MTNATVVRALSAVQVHHPAEEVNQVLALDGKLRLMGQFPRYYSVFCDCCASDGKLDPEDCAGLRVHDRRGNPVATFRGKQYRAIENSDRTIGVFSTLVRN